MPLQQGKTIPLQNPCAYGNAWFVDKLTYVDGAKAEMAMLKKINRRVEAVADKSFRERARCGLCKCCRRHNIEDCAHGIRTQRTHIQCGFEERRCSCAFRDLLSRLDGYIGRQRHHDWSRRLCVACAESSRRQAHACLEVRSAIAPHNGDSCLRGIGCDVACTCCSGGCVCLSQEENRIREISEPYIIYNTAKP